MIDSSPTSLYPNDGPPTVALAILYRDDRFLLQLRDNIPTILYPGYWGLFGGHIEPEETPEVAVKREIWEEITYELTGFQFFDIYTDQFAIRHVFYAPLTVPLDQLILHEGWDFGLITAEEIQQGQIYSEKAQQLRPLGKIHQKILGDFLNAELH